MPHLKMWEIMDRANDGPFVEDDDFLYKIFLPKMKQVGAQVRHQVRSELPGAGR